MSLFSGKLKFRKCDDCACEYECFLYLFTGYDRKSFRKFIVCPSCLAKNEEDEKVLSHQDIEIKEEIEKEKLWKLWEDEMSEPGTTDDKWSIYTQSGFGMTYY